MLNKPKILVVDDDKFMTEFLSEGLSKAYDVIATSEADIAYRVATQSVPDAMLIDIHINQDDGIHLCRRLRENLLTKSVPIIVITGMGSREKMFSAFDVGADDYVEKPIDLPLLENRLRSRMKRIESLAQKSKAVGNMKFHADRSEIELNGKVHRLSQTELALLKLLLININRNVSRQEIMKTLWTDSNVGERTIDVHVSSLRRKLKDFDHQIEALYGSGYILRPQNHATR